jgi:hypothetical protein
MTIGAEAFAEKETAQQAFGFDIKKAGLLPVQVVMDNRSGDDVEVLLEQTFLVDNTNRYWNLISNRAAVERVAKATETGAILGKSVAESAGKGAAVGAAGGAVYGGAKEGTEAPQKRTIADDIRDKGLEGKVIPDQSLANGFLFFPAEAQSAGGLKLQVWKTGSGRVSSFSITF